MAVTVLAAIAQTVIQGGGWAMFFKTLAVTAGLSAVSRALTPKVDGSMLKGTNVTSREPTASRKIVYGRSRVGGTVAYIETNNNGSGSANEYLHLVIALAGHEIDAYEEVYFNEKKIWDNGSYLLTWGDYVHIGFHKGDQTTADADLVASSNKWTSNHVLNGTAYLYVRLKYDAEQFAQGLPNISAVIRGKKVYNPTTEVTEWSQNPALCIRDYLLDSRYGLAESASNINATALASAQSICDQSVLLDSGASHPRYVLDGVVDTSESRKNNIEAMLSAMGGKLIYSGGQYFVSAAAYSAPTVSIDESVLSGTISVQTKQSRRTLYNGVKGVFVSEEDNYIVADYPSITSSAYSAEDGEPIFLDMVLPFTTNNIRAQRLAKLALLQSRKQTSITLPCNLAALKFKAGDNISVSNTRLGYTNKVFEVIGYDMTLADDGSIVVEVNAIETDSSIYDWTTSDEEVYLGAGEVELYDGLTAAAPTSLNITGDSFLNSDGTFNTAFNVAWTDADDAFTDHYVVEWKKASDSNYFTMYAKASPAVITGLQNSQQYNVRVKAVNEIGVSSTYISSAPTAAVDTTAPSVPSPVSASGQYQHISISWTNPTQKDLSHIDVYRSSSSGGTYSLIGNTDGTVFIDDDLANAATFYYKVKAIDFTGNASAFSSVVSATTTTIASGDLGNDAVGTGNIQDDAITNALIATDAVNQDSIAANSVTAVEIVAGTITATEIASNTITAGQIASNTITASQIAANTLTANEIQASSITVDKLSGDVSELYPASIYENITLTSTTQFTQDFAIPAPSLGISKRQRLDLDFDFSTANTSGTDHEVQFLLNMQRKSKSATGNAVGTVTLASGAPPFNQWVYISGNVLALVDNTGGVADNSSGSGTTGNINSVYYDSGNNRTYIMVSSSSAVFSNGETLYFSASKFASAGTWTSADYGINSRIFVPTGKTVNFRIPFSNTYGESSTVTEFRPSIVGTTNISNVTCRLVKWIGTMENVS